MPDDDFSRSQRDWLDRWLFGRMSDVGMGMDGEDRKKTQLGFWFLNDRREAWNTPDEIKDRDWVRRMREASGRKSEGVRQVITGLISAILGALALFALSRLGVK